MAARTQRERDAVRRDEKLAEIDEQLAAGRLSIRQMTPEERERYAPRSKEPRRPSRRRAR
ncbi:MAG TPA: hypothetical protein VFZ89_02700 [Solirubrobacteraceae bacterium]